MMDKKNIIKNKFQFKNETIIFLLLPVGIISYLIRSYYFEPEVALTFDSLGYFFYSVDIMVLGHLPEDYTLANTLWPIFLSIFFPFFQFENTIQYMDLQKNLAIILSTITIIPIYFLCRKFFESKIALVGAIIFGLEPRLIQNSMIGITESLYILLGTITLVLFLSSNKKLVYLSFMFAAFTTLTRSEGQMIFLIISIMFFVRYRKEKLIIPKYFIALSIFLIIISPMMIHQSTILENDSIFGKAANTITYHTKDPNETGGESGLPFFVNGIENFSKFFLWDLIPIFIFFVPIGIFYLFKNIDFKKLSLILWGFVISIPAFYAYSIPLQDTRFLFMLYPIFCVISLFFIENFSNKYKRKNLLIILVIIGISFSSIVFLETKPSDNLQKYESYQIAKDIVREHKIINSFYPEDNFLEPAAYPEKWNDFKKLFLLEREQGKSIRNSILNPIIIIPTNGYISIEEFIKQNNELTHIYVDQNENRPQFLKKIYQNENQYEFLIKEYDSKDFGYNYHVKIFRIIK